MARSATRGARRRRARTAVRAGFVLDSGALIALERNKGRASRLMIALLERAPHLKIPAGVLAQVWRDGARQARLARLVRAPSVEIVPLDRPAAQAVGALIAEREHPDIVDVHVVLCSRRSGQAVVTSDPDDLRQIDPKLPILVL